MIDGNNVLVTEMMLNKCDHCKEVTFPTEIIRFIPFVTLLTLVYEC